MPNKIAGFNLNNSPKNLNSEFYIAQPDGVKENLGGKLFMLIQSDAKRSDLIELADFLVSLLDKYYYEDEKILLREKLDNLKVENIFEAMLAKINNDLSAYLEDSKNKINLKTLSLSIGVAYNNEIYFSQLGNNKSFVIYKKEDQFETLKLNQEDENEENTFKPQINKLFSNVISGEIPTGAFFVLCNENLSEYISSETFKGIITNLPPLGASEQIKNKLKEINARVPFSAVIVKNTYGQSEAENYKQENIKASTSLKQTEEKTAKLLSTAGLINKDKLKQRFNKIKKLIQPTTKPKKVLMPKKDKEATVENLKPSSGNQRKVQLKDKIFMKKKPGILAFFKDIISVIPGIAKNSWKSTNKNKPAKILNFRKREKLIFTGILALIIIFVGSILIINYQNKIAEEKLAYQEQVREIEKNQNQIDSYLLYGNEDSALSLLQETQDLIASLDQEKPERKETYQEFKSKSEEQLAKLRHVVNISLDKLVDLPNNQQASSMIAIDNSLYLSNENNSSLYKVDIDSMNIETINLETSLNNLAYPSLDNFNNLYYLQDENSILQILLPEQEIQNINLDLPSDNAEISAMEGYGTRFYILDKNNSQVYRYNNNTNSLSFNANWINNTEDLSNPVDMEIDISIFFLSEDGSVSKFSSGQKEDFNMDAVDPKINNAKKLILTDTNAYILEENSNRLLQFEFADPNKTKLDFKNQYYFENINNIDDIFIDNDNILYLLEGSRVYTTNLNID